MAYIIWIIDDGNPASANYTCTLSGNYPDNASLSSLYRKRFGPVSRPMLLIWKLWWALSRESFGELCREWLISWLLWPTSWTYPHQIMLKSLRQCHAHKPQTINDPSERVHTWNFYILNRNDFFLLSYHKAWCSTTFWDYTHFGIDEIFYRHFSVRLSLAVPKAKGKMFRKNCLGLLALLVFIASCGKKIFRVI